MGKRKITSSMRLGASKPLRPRVEPHLDKCATFLKEVCNGALPLAECRIREGVRVDWVAYGRYGVPAGCVCNRFIKIEACAVGQYPEYSISSQPIAMFGDNPQIVYLYGPHKGMTTLRVRLPDARDPQRDGPQSGEEVLEMLGAAELVPGSPIAEGFDLVMGAPMPYALHRKPRSPQPDQAEAKQPSPDGAVPQPQGEELDAAPQTEEVVAGPAPKPVRWSRPDDGSRLVRAATSSQPERLGTIAERAMKEKSRSIGGCGSVELDLIRDELLGPLYFSSDSSSSVSPPTTYDVSSSEEPSSFTSDEADMLRQQHEEVLVDDPPYSKKSRKEAAILRGNPAWRRPYKAGNKSVHYSCTTSPKMQVPNPKQRQNIISQMSNMHRTNNSHIFISPAAQGAHANWQSQLHINTPDQNLRQAQVAGQFTRTVAALPPANLEVTTPRSFPVDEMSTACATTYLVAPGVVNTNVTAAALPSVISISHDVSKAVAAQLLMNRERVDNSTLYGAGILLMFDLQTKLAMGQVAALAPGVMPLPVVDTTAAGAAALPVITAMTQHIADGTFVFFAKDLTAADLSVLAIIAHGLPAMANPAAGLPISVGQAISTPGIGMVIYSPGGAALPPLQVPLPSQVLTCLNKVAAMRGESSHFARGFVRASTLYNLVESQYVAPGPAAAQADIFKTSIGEIGRSVWPRPRDSNWLWRALKIAPVPEEAEVFEGEATELASNTPAVLNRVGIAIAALMATAIGSVWHYFNITGACLTLWATGAGMAGTAVVTLLNQLNTTPEYGMVPLVMGLTCGIVSQLCGSSVNMTCYSGPSWSGGGTGLPQAAVVGPNFWAADAPHSVDYIANPLAAAWLYDIWLDIWGIGDGPVTYCLDDELKTNSPMANQNGWWSTLGDKRYTTASKTDPPHVYRPYGALLLNALAQGWNLAAMVVVNFLQVAIVNDRYDQSIPGVWHPPQYHAALCLIVPGTLLTYEWSTGYIMAPIVTQGAFGAVNWGYATVKGTKVLTNAGIPLPFQAPVAGQIINIWDSCLIEGLQHMGVSLASGSGKEKTAEEAEN
nr:hypothetical protein [Mute swan feces associated toti-like virus 3]